MDTKRPAYDGAGLRSLIAFVSTASAADGDDVLRLLVIAAKESLGADAVSLTQWDPVLLQFRHVVSDSGPGAAPLSEDPREAPALRAFTSEGSLALDAVGYVGSCVSAHTPVEVQDLLVGMGKSSCIAVPVMVDDHVWGAIWATRPAGTPEFGDHDLELARLAAAQASAGVRQGEHLASVQRLAYTDELTGLANRRAFEDRLDLAVRDHLAAGTCVGLIVLDVNGLKRVNDRYGHQAGDAALVALAKVLASLAAYEAGTLVARLGGDEFAVPSVGRAADDVVALAHTLARRAFDVLEEGAACGLALAGELPGPQITPGRLLRAADAAQYRAKQSGITVPVVAGRLLVLPESDHPAAQDRRTYRDRGEEVTLLQHLVKAADDAGPAVLERLCAVAQAAAAGLHAAGWWVSELSAGGTEMFTRRHGTVLGLAEIEDGLTYDITSFPATAAVLAGGACHIGIDDPHADAAELALLTRYGLRELLMAGALAPDGNAWLVEVFGDEICVPLHEHLTELRAGVVVAVCVATPET
ncbi:MAG: sensor domain-containing diguanylate cyclase [Candidatus Nanopelagicales bacterium]